MTRENLAEVLEEIALLLELKGENPFKIRAYRGGAETVRQFSGDIVTQAREGDLKGIKGIGEALQQKLNDLSISKTSEPNFPRLCSNSSKFRGWGQRRSKLCMTSWRSTLWVD